MKHAVIIRFDYPDEIDFSYRLALFQVNMLARLQRQTDKNFEIWVRCNPVHNKIIESLGCFVFNVSGKAPRNEFGAFQGWSVDIFKDYDIQTRVDYDDIVSLNFIKRIHSEFRPGLLLSFNYDIIRWWTMEMLRHIDSIRHNEKRNSMFLSLMKGDPFIYSKTHTQMWQVADAVKLIEHGYCWHVRHDKNAS